MIGLRVALVIAIPVWRVRFRIDRGSALRFRRGEQCCVVFLGGLLWIRAKDTLPRQICSAITPRGRSRRIRADPALIPHFRKLPGRIAPVVTLIHPDGLVFVEVLRQEQVERQRLYPCGRSKDNRRCTSSSLRQLPDRSAAPLSLRLL